MGGAYSGGCSPGDVFSKAGFQNPAHVFSHLLEVNDRLQQDPIGTIIQYAQSLPADQQQQLRQAFGGTQTGYTEAQVNALFEQRIQSLIAEVQPEIAQREKAAAEAAVAQYKQAQARMQQKVRASNASLSGAPHRAQSAPPRNRAARGTFADVAGDVCAAMNSLGI